MLPIYFRVLFCQSIFSVPSVSSVFQSVSLHWATAFFLWPEKIRNTTLCSILYRIKPRFQKWYQKFNPYRFQYQTKIIRVIQIAKKCILFLFVAIIYFPLSIQMNILKLYDNCYIVLTTLYMLDRALEPWYNL